MIIPCDHQRMGPSSKEEHLSSVVCLRSHNAAMVPGCYSADILGLRMLNEFPIRENVVSV